MSGFTAIDLHRYCNFGFSNVKLGGRWLWKEGEKSELAGLPIGKQKFYGIPFLIPDPSKNDGKGLVVLARRKGLPQRVTIPIGKKAAYVIIAHFSDMSNTAESEMWGAVNPGEHMADYVFHFGNGKSVSQPIRRRFEISDYAHGWGQLPFNSRSHSRHVPADQPVPWGRKQTGVSGGDYGPRVKYWLYCWPNPEPDEKIVEIEFAATGGDPIAVTAITLGHEGEHPFQHDGRKAVRVDFTGKEARAEWDVDVEMDRGVVVKVSPLHGRPEDFINAPLKGWGEKRPQKLTRKSTYVEAYGVPSAELKLKTKDGERSVRWGDIFEGSGAKSSDGVVKVGPLYGDKTWVHAEVADASTGKPTPVRVHFRGPGGEYIAPYGHQTDVNPNWFEDVGGDLLLGGMAYAYVDGKFQIELPVGPVYVEIVKGFEYRPVRKKLEIKKGQRTLKLQIRRWTDMNELGYYSGDTHVHFISTQTGLLEAKCEGINVANILAAQWGKLFTNVEDFTGAPSGVSTDDTIIYVNSENRHHVLGHLILLGLKEPVFPLSSGGADEAYLGDPNEVTLADWCDRCHEQEGLVVAPHFPNPHCELAADIALGKIDAAEIRPSVGGMNNYALGQWYRYLNLGYRLPCVGGTDKMVNTVPVGGIRTYACIGRGQPFTYVNWCEAIRSGRSFTSTGPLISLSVDGLGLGDTIQMSSSGGTVEIEAEASCAHPLERLQIVQNGRVVLEASARKGSGKISLREKLFVDKSCWIAARCWGMAQPWSLSAHTSPIYAYLDQSEIFSPADATYMLTLIEGGITWAKNIGVFRDEKKRLEMIKLFEAGREAIHSKMHERGHEHSH